MTLTDDVIALRPPVAADLPALFEATRESVDLLSVWMTWCRPTYALEDCQAFVKKAAAERKKGLSHDFVIFDRPGQTLFGSISLNHLHSAHKTANVGYWVRQTQSRRGLASRALRLVSRYAFSELGLNRLEIVVPSGNIASQRVAQKAGATFEGLLRQKLRLNGKYHDAVIYSLIKEDLEEGAF